MSPGDVATRLAEWEDMGDCHRLSPGSGIDETCEAYDTDDSPQDWVVSLYELLSIIQYCNIGGYTYCPTSGTEDGYCLGLYGWGTGARFFPRARKRRPAVG